MGNMADLDIHLETGGSSQKNIQVTLTFTLFFNLTQEHEVPKPFPGRMIYLKEITFLLKDNIRDLVVENRLFFWTVIST